MWIFELNFMLIILYSKITTINFLIILKKYLWFICKLDNYINYTSPDGVLPLTINNNDTFNIIKYDPLYKLDSKNKFIVL